jgi:hypothetical protein
MTTNRPYRGINAFMLHLLADEAGYSSNRWLTYRQAASLGAHVERGERGVPVIFYQRREPAQKLRIRSARMAAGRAPRSSASTPCLTSLRSMACGWTRRTTTTYPKMQMNEQKTCCACQAQ